MQDQLLGHWRSIVVGGPEQKQKVKSGEVVFVRVVGGILRGDVFCNRFGLHENCVAFGSFEDSGVVLVIDANDLV